MNAVDQFWNLDLRSEKLGVNYFVIPLKNPYKITVHVKRRKKQPEKNT